MLARYKIFRGKRPPGEDLPDGVRQDTRKHTRHVLAPEPKLVFRYLAKPSDAAWAAFRQAYRELLASRFADRREEFDALADGALWADVYIGCNCPTKANPDVGRCHTVLALNFMKQKYRKLKIVLPESD
jgi:hypothetical protein